MLRFALIILLIVVFFNLIFRYLIPRRLRKMTENMKNAAEEKQEEYNNKGKKEGEVTINKKSTTKKSGKNSDKGEYVDYEEIND